MFHVHKRILSRISAKAVVGIQFELNFEGQDPEARQQKGRDAERTTKERAKWSLIIHALNKD